MTEASGAWANRSRSAGELPFRGRGPVPGLLVQRGHRSRGLDAALPFSLFGNPHKMRPPYLYLDSLFFFFTRIASAPWRVERPHVVSMSLWFVTRDEAVLRGCTFVWRKRHPVVSHRREEFGREESALLCTGTAIAEAQAASTVARGGLCSCPCGRDPISVLVLCLVSRVPDGRCVSCREGGDLDIASRSRGRKQMYVRRQARLRRLIFPGARGFCGVRCEANGQRVEPRNPLQGPIRGSYPYRSIAARRRC